MYNLGILLPNAHRTILNLISQSLFTEHLFVVGRTGVENKRTMLFYHVARHDGLEKLEMDPVYLIQHFRGRLDLLYYRKVDYQPIGQGQGEELKRNVLVGNIFAVVCVCVLNSLFLSGIWEVATRWIAQHFSHLCVTDCRTVDLPPSVALPNTDS